jgi:hypothetical protein
VNFTVTSFLEVDEEGEDWNVSGSVIGSEEYKTHKHRLQEKNVTQSEQLSIKIRCLWWWRIVLILSGFSCKTHKIQRKEPEIFGFFD